MSSSDQWGSRLDPADWDSFSLAFHDLASRCIARMRGARDEPWRPRDASFREAVALDDVAAPAGVESVFEAMADAIMPAHSGATHPRFFGWVQGTGLPQAVAAEMVAATMNSNCGGRDHGATDVERAVIEWVAGVAGWGPDAFGILTSGTSQATINVMHAARVAAFGDDVRRLGVRGLPEIAVYVAVGGHSCVGKALEVLGHGAQALREIPLAQNGRGDGIDLDALRARIGEDRAAGVHPLAIVGTAGSVNTGFFDPLDALADIARDEGLWLHVDAAFGFWTRLADEPWRALAAGIERADSFAADFHKWVSVPYDCGVAMVRDGATLRAAFNTRPDYLAPQEAGLGGGDVWFCDYGPELSRGFRALKVWATVKACGTDALGAAISDNCRQAAFMAELVEATDGLTLAAPVVSNVCCFFVDGAEPDAIAARLQTEGEVVFSTTRIDGRSALRAAIVNHRTTRADIERSIAAVQ